MLQEKRLSTHWKSGKFNSLYGMTVTNNIRKTVKYDNKIGWLPDEDLKNDEIISKLKKEKRDGFLSFSWRCLVYILRKI